MSKQPSLKSGLDKMAAELLALADEAETLHVKVDVFKVVSAFYIATAKVQKGQPIADETATTFGAIRNRVNGTKTMKEAE